MTTFLDTKSINVIDESNRARYLDGDVSSDLYPRDEFDKHYARDYE